MAGDRPRYGLLISAMGAIVLAVSVFLPWYGVSFTASGLAFAQQAGDQAAAQFGNATLQSYMGEFHANLSSLAGHQFTALSAHQALKDLNVVLLLLAGAAIVIALLALAGAGFSSTSAPDGHRAPLILLGIVAAACVLFRIIDPPAPAGGFLRFHCARAPGWRCSARRRSLWDRCGRSASARPIRRTPSSRAFGPGSPAGRLRVERTEIPRYSASVRMNTPSAVL
jgi:hypothetical protein